MSKSWSFQAAQRVVGSHNVDLPGIGKGKYSSLHGVESVEGADPPVCEQKIIEYLRDEREAQSRRYGAGTLAVLPLRSGRLAIFDLQRQLITNADATEVDSPLLQALQKWSAEAEELTRKMKEVRQQTTEVMTAEELGL